jgi:hypothetical protein
MDFNDELFKVHKVIGHVAHWRHSETDEYALHKFNIRRGDEPYDIPITPRQALAHLEASPDMRGL